jgi:small subunit ribosomal protein S6
MKKYETVVVFNGSLPEETTAKEQQKFEEFLKENGSLENTDVWGKKDLAYEIKGAKTGFYSLFLFSYDGDATTIVNDYFRFNENIIRTMTILHEDAVIVKKVVTDEAATPAKDD